MHVYIDAIFVTPVYSQDVDLMMILNCCVGVTIGVDNEIVSPYRTPVFLSIPHVKWLCYAKYLTRKINT